MCTRTCVRAHTHTFLSTSPFFMAFLPHYPLFFPRQIITLLFCSANYWLNKKNAYYLDSHARMWEYSTYVWVSSKDSRRSQCYEPGHGFWELNSDLLEAPEQLIHLRMQKDPLSTGARGIRELISNCWAHRFKAGPRSRPLCTGSFLGSFRCRSSLGSVGQELVSSPCVFLRVRGYSRLPSCSATPPSLPPSKFLKIREKSFACYGLFSSLLLILLFKLLKHPFNFILIEFWERDQGSENKCI